MARTRTHGNSLGLLGKVSMAASGALLCAALVGCGGSSSSETPASTNVLLASPAKFAAFGDTPNVIGISGGTGPYTVTSSDPVLVPVTLAIDGASFTFTPKNVQTDTVVTLTVKDSKGATSPVAVTVTPATIPAGKITVVGAVNSVCAIENNSAITTATICQSETGTASVTLRDSTGAVLANRAVLFEALSTGAAFAEKADSAIFARLATVNTDANGVATVALRGDVEAVSEAALLRATDKVSTHRVDTWITVLKQTSGVSALSIVPASGGLIGYYTNECSEVVREYGIHGGKAPYTVTLPASNTLILAANGVESLAGAATTVAAAGARFTVKQPATTTCPTSSTLMTVTDALGATSTASFTVASGGNTRSTVAATDLVVTPPTLSFVADASSTYCTSSSARFAVAGGTAPYVVSSSIPQIATTLTNGNVVDASFVSNAKWKMLKGQTASVLVLDSVGKVTSAVLSCN
ncbi:MAG: hypothetical protein ABL985_00175 [Casimicrobium sp.]